MKFEDIIGEKIVIEFKLNSEINEFKKWCVENNIKLLYKLDKYLKCYRIDYKRELQGDSSSFWYKNEGYKIINYKEFNINNISFKDLFNECNDRFKLDLL